MNQTSAPGLTSAIEAAVPHVKRATRRAAARAVDGLGVSALASADAQQRDALLNAQFELNRKLALFCSGFDEVLDQKVRTELQRVLRSPEAAQTTTWHALRLVDDHEVENQVNAERLGQQIGQDCEAEQRELESFVASALQDHDEALRNPLRPEIIGNAIICSVDEVTDRADLRKLLSAELARSLAASMAETYAAIVADLRAAGFKPTPMGFRASERSGSYGRTSGGYDTSSRPAGLGDSTSGTVDSRHSSWLGSGARSSERGQLGVQGHATASGRMPAHAGTPIGHVDAELMSLIRRLAFVDLGAERDGASTWAAETGTAPLQSGFATAGAAHTTLALPNLIRANREALRQASTGSLDHMVIDLIGSLFDQILSDPKVQPQMARQIARLQLPVLRAALGDPSFFASRKHPVRRFVNRIASMGSAFDDFGSESGKLFLTLVSELVQEIVEGDFDQIETYEQKLVTLETFIVEQSRHEVQERSGAATLLAEKETDLRLQQRYAQQLQTLLKPLPVPDFVRDFISQVWSQAMMRVARRDGGDSPRAQRLRHAGRELIMSVQPKGSPEQRKAFLTQLPALMKELNEGIDLVGWPEAAKKDFFGQLLPAHAESLKGQALSTLQYNLLARQVDSALGEGIPEAAELPPPLPNVPVLRDEAILPSFSAEEAQRIGLVDESKVDWNGKIDIDLSADAPLPAGGSDIPGLPRADATEPGEPAEPTSGKSLADHVQIGFAYQMHLQDKWQKVRLNHVSPGRSFFVFTHGGRHKQTVSMTYRMLLRLCETGRLRAFENAYLIERATARARRQLASLGGNAAA
jgi:hypothetical protein